MKVYLYINKQGFKENTFRVAFKELVRVVKDEQSKPTAYLVGKFEVRDYEHSYDVPYNKKYENRYFASCLDIMLINIQQQVNRNSMAMSVNQTRILY